MCARCGAPVSPGETKTAPTILVVILKRIAVSLEGFGGSGSWFGGCAQWSEAVRPPSDNNL